MAFGNASLPTRKYVYGAREFLPGARADAPSGAQLPRARFPGHEAAVEQLRAAHALQNELVAIELARRERANRIVHEAFPDLAALLSAAETLDAELARLRGLVQESKVALRSRTPDPEPARRARECAANRSNAWAAHKARKGAAYADAAVRAALDASDEEAETAKSAARSAAVAGIPERPAEGDRPGRPALPPLYWATSLIVVQRVKKTGPPPRFKSFTGEGLLAVQFQRKPDRASEKVPVLDRDGNPRIHPRSGKPMTRHAAGGSQAADAIHLRNTLCWVEDRGGRDRYKTAHFRVGSTDAGAPVWADVPFVLHRPLPGGAEVKWAHLSRRKVGTHHKWEVQFDVALSAEAWAVHDATSDARRSPARSPLRGGRAPEGTVAVALGWRRIDDAVRVAVWVGSDGRTGEVVIPALRVSQWSQCDALRGARDKRFEEDKEYLREWLARQNLPAEWKDRARHLPQWLSAARLASLVNWWRDHRLPGDAAAFARMDGELVPAERNGGAKVGLDRYTGGRRQDRHLFDWAENRRAKCRAWRKHFYRHVALELAAHYRRAVAAEIDWHTLAENPAPEETCDERVNKTYRGMAACASLRGEIGSLLELTRLPAANITVTCHRCGTRCASPGAGRWVHCESCGGEPVDRALNAANNLLRRALQGAEDLEPARVA